MKLSPLNEDGQPVDWWFCYKVPRLDPSGTTAAAKGFEYAYYDDLAKAVVASKYTMDSHNGALGQTLDSLFQQPDVSTGWILYNDEVPDGATSSSYGHTKGVIGFDVASNTGFWLLHSWPKFPLPDLSATPSPMYGQTFLCIALDLDNLRNLATQMRSFQQPQVYQPRIPASLAPDDPLRLLSRDVDLGAAAGSNDITLTTPGKNKFTVIAKNKAWDKDFWDALVAPTLQTSIDVETWIRGGPTVIPPTIDPSGKYNINDMKFISLEAIDAKALPWEWPETKDHAKWAISVDNQDFWICVGDINRMKSQEKRGGCTIAFQDEVLWQQLKLTDVIIPPKGSGLSKADALKALKTAKWEPKDPGVAAAAASAPPAPRGSRPAAVKPPKKKVTRTAAPKRVPRKRAKTSTSSKTRKAG